MARRVIELALRLGLAAIFLYAGALHAWDAPAFVQAIQAYDLLPPDAAMVLGVYLPWVEIFAAIGLLARWLYLGSLAAIGGMLLAFLGGLISAWSRGLDISCGCFRTAESIQTHFPWLVTRDVAMLAAVAALWWLERRRA
jgi:ABC-type sugar transport system permease subunit